MHSVRAYDSITGDRVTILPCSEGTWEPTLAADGQGTFTARFRDKRMAGWTKPFWDRLRRRETTLVAFWNQTPRFAGMVVHSPFDLDAGTVTFQTTEHTEVMRRRLIKGAGTYDPKGLLELTGLSTVGLIVELLRIVVGGGKDVPIEGSNTPWNLPVRLPAAPAGSRSLISYENKMERPMELIKALLGESGAPDFRLKPTIDPDGSLALIPEFGNPRLDSSRHEFQVMAARSPLTGFKQTVDSTAQYTGLQVTGEGTDEARLVATVPRGAGTRTPAMDSVISFGREEDVDKLARMGEGRLDGLREPVESTTFKLTTSAAAAMQPGSRVTLRAAGMPVLGDFVSKHYVTSMKESLGATTIEPKVVPL